MSDNVSAELVSARLLRGFRDYLPKELIARDRMIAAIRRVFESHGFVPLATPAMEPLDVLGRSDLEDDIFKVVDPEDPRERYGMRFDLTVPLARVVSQYADLPRPFRRYQYGPVWRVDKPGPGRFREFMQFDLDVVGSADMEADAEIIACMVETLEALKLPSFRVRTNNRKVLNGALDFAGVPQQDSVRLETLRSLDKMDRLGFEGVAELLGPGRKDETGDFKRGVGLSVDAIQKLGQYLEVPRGERAETLSTLRELLGTYPRAQEGIAELERIDSVLTSLGVASDKASFDSTIVRGLAYYTGPVFEAVLLDALEFGSVFGGGRYDGLVRRFQAEDVPAVGASVGVDRLLVAMKHLKLIEERSSTADVLITVMDAARRGEYQRMAQELRSQGIPAEVFLGTGGFRKQLKYADKVGIPVALIAGEDEFKNDQVSLKDLWAGAEISKQIQDNEAWKQNPTQVTVARQELVAAVQSMLERQQKLRQTLRR